MKQRFCEHCEVVLELHPSGVQTDDPIECEVAEARALMINRFWSAAIGRGQ